jgi:hypothetical protein
LASSNSLLVNTCMSPPENRGFRLFCDLGATSPNAALSSSSMSLNVRAPGAWAPPVDARTAASTMAAASEAIRAVRFMVLYPFFVDGGCRT